MDKNDRLTITDHIVNGPQASTAAWNMATNAEAQIVDDNTILLRQDGKQLYLKLRTKADAKAVIRPEHQYKPFEIKDKNLRMVGFDIHLAAGEEAEIEVTFSPQQK